MLITYQKLRSATLISISSSKLLYEQLQKYQMVGLTDYRLVRDSKQEGPSPVCKAARFVIIIVMGGKQSQILLAQNPTS